MRELREMRDRESQGSHGGDDEEWCGLQRGRTGNEGGLGTVGAAPKYAIIDIVFHPHVCCYLCHI